MKKLLSMILIAVMTFAMFACGSAFAEGEGAVEEGAFNIGVYMWMSSGAATVGEEMKKAFAIAVDDMGGQVNGEDVNFLYYDTQNNPEIAVTAAQYLIGQNVDAVIGSFQSGDVVAAYPFLERAGIVNVFMGTSGSIVTDDQKYSFRGSFNADYSINSFVDMFVNDLGYENIAIFYGQDEASVANEQAMEPALKEAGLNVVAVETGASEDTDYSAQCLRIVDANPDAVYVVCSGAGVNFVKQLREYGYNGMIMDKDEWMTSHVDQIGENNSNYVAGCVAYTTYKSIDAAREAGARAEVIEFLEKYQAKYNELPSVGITYRCYDSAMILFTAATNAGTNHDSEKIVEEIGKLNGFNLCMGPVDFTQGDREPSHEFMKVIYDNGGSRNFIDWMGNGGYDAFKAATGRDK